MRSRFFKGEINRQELEEEVERVMGRQMPLEYKNQKGGDEKVKVIVHKEGLLHIETPLGITNISVGLKDFKGRRMENFEVIPDHFSGGGKVVRRGLCNIRLVELKTKRR